MVYNTKNLISITIPENVEVLGDYCFSESRDLETVSFSQTSEIKAIKSGLFRYSRKLKSVNNVPSSITSIGSQAFIGCYELVSLTLPEGVTSIGSSAFDNCNKLNQLNLPNSVTSLGSDCFYACYALPSITLPNTISGIGRRAFYSCKLLEQIDFDGTEAE